MPTSPGETAELISSINTLGVVPFIAVVLALIGLAVSYFQSKAQKPLIDANTKGMSEIAVVSRELVSVIRQNTSAWQDAGSASEKQTKMLADTLSALANQAKDARVEDARERKSVMDKLDAYHQAVTGAIDALRTEMTALKEAISALDVDSMSKRFDTLFERITEIEQIVTPKPEPPAALAPPEVKDRGVPETVPPPFDSAPSMGKRDAGDQP